MKVSVCPWGHLWAFGTLHISNDMGRPGCLHAFRSETNHANHEAVDAGEADAATTLWLSCLARG